ncbi:MAG: EF-hand domain-containing protein [Anaerolineae bacterium]|nr:EF-hand domain-containing protein [Anaerolineae bacterium]
MLTDLQRRKMTRFFRVYDINGSGFIEESDYMRIAHNFAQMRGFKPSSTEYARLETKFQFVWDYMRKFGDPNRDYSVSLEEFLAYASSVMEDNYAAVEGSTGNFLFELIDGDSDGRITLDEFRLFYRGYDIQDTVVDHIFRKLDLNADSVISAEEFSQLGYDFHHSDDPDSPANWFFGPF